MARSFNKTISKIATAGLLQQKKDGSFPKGVNGPWKTTTTPLRTTAHWSIFFFHAYKKFSIPSYLKAAEKGISYIHAKTNYSKGEIQPYKCLQSSDPVTQVNGLIGQAWVLEALIEDVKSRNNKVSRTILEQFAKKAKLDLHYNLWIVLDFNGNNSKIHSTLNHQVWFNLMLFRIANLLQDKQLKTRCSKAAEAIIRFTRIKENLPAMKIKVSFSNILIHPLRYIPNVTKNFFNLKQEGILRQGYATFTILGMLLTIPYVNLTTKNRILNIARNGYQQLHELHEKKIIQNNAFCYGYNVFGIEMQAIQQLLTQNNCTRDLTSENWMKLQLELNYNNNKNLLCENTVDPETLQARIYETTYLEDIN